eukprot:Ihof_evm3s357 gene=Ihof_evmTU3s357
MARKKKGTVVESKRPINIPFWQQKLSSWQPVLMPKTVLPVLFLIGLIYIPLGVVFFTFDARVKEFTLDYTNCQSSNYPGQLCIDVIKSVSPATANCQCLLTFDLKETFTDQVYLYYELDQYHQNHRRYVRSRNDAQLTGEDGNLKSCNPLRELNGVPIAPCGFIANSMFNDTISLLGVPLTANSITWPSDASHVFKNPRSFDRTVSPPSWTHNVTNFPQVEIYPELTQGYTNKDLIVWMRVASLPTFRKLYRKVLGKGLQAGQYQFNITYNYPVHSFKGSKKVVLATLSFLGNKNPFLGVGYLVVGSLSVCIALLLLLKHLIAP